VGVVPFLIKLGGASRCDCTLQLVVLELHDSLVGAQIAARVSIDADVAVKRPTTVLEITGGRERSIRAHGHLSVGDRHILQAHREANESERVECEFISARRAIYWGRQCPAPRILNPRARHSNWPSCRAP